MTTRKKPKFRVGDIVRPTQHNPYRALAAERLTIRVRVISIYKLQPYIKVERFGTWHREFWELAPARERGKAGKRKPDLPEWELASKGGCGDG